MAEYLSLTKRFFSQQTTGASTVFWFGISSTNKFSVEIRGSNGAGDNQIYGTTTPVVGTWYHVAFVKSGTNWYLFVNGILEATAQAYKSWGFDWHDPKWEGEK